MFWFHELFIIKGRLWPVPESNTMEETLRTRRVAELIRQEVSAIIRNEVHDPKVSEVVITAVKVTKDLDLARIFFTSYDKSELQVIKSGLERSSGFIRRQLMQSVRLKKIPRLEFVVDSTNDEADKIDALLGMLNKGNKDGNERSN